MNELSELAIFQWPLRVYIEDTDAGGIVYYVNYLKYIERARTEFLRSLGFGKQAIFNTDLMFVVRAVNSEYLKPALLDDELIATAEVVEVGRVFLVMRQCVYRIESRDLIAKNELLFKAEVKLACVDRQSIKPQRIPADMIALINK
ncbi:MAG: YbgC/FadM family acyl-CoA thioesterase [Spongiibacteraceae bacterium]